MNPDAPLTLDALQALAADPASTAGWGVLANRPALLIDARATELTAAVRDWLRGLAYPVIAIDPTPTPLAAACDTRVDSLADALPLLKTIAQAPIAAATAMQVLRAVESLPLA